MVDSEAQNHSSLMLMRLLWLPLIGAAMCVSALSVADEPSSLSPRETEFVHLIFVALGITVQCHDYKMAENSGLDLAARLGIDGEPLLAAVSEVVKRHKGIGYNPIKYSSEVDRVGTAALTGVRNIISANLAAACAALGTAFVSSGLLARTR